VTPTKIDPAMLTRVAHDAILSDAALGMIASLSNPLLHEAIPETWYVEHMEQQLNRAVRHAGRCANLVCDVVRLLDVIAEKHSR
jgi:hypothetical protein